MRIVLVFPPKASATYVPIGIASLAPYIEMSVPDASVALLDLNIETWHHLAKNDPRGRDLIEFVHGRAGDFLDHGETLHHKIVWDSLRKRMGEYADQARCYAETGETGDGYARVLAAQVESILASDPELVGFSVLFPEQFPFAAAMARAVKHALASRLSRAGSRCRVVMGGAAVSALSVNDLLAACSYVDGVVVGEGEQAAAALCSGVDWAAVPGLVYRGTSGVVTNPKTQTLSLRSLPPPDFTRLPLDDYFNPVPVLPVLFSRGCSWRRCRFCAHNFAFAGHRKKDVEAFVDELEGYYTRLGVRYIYSADEFIAPPDMDAIANAIKSRGLDISYHVLGKPIQEYTLDSMALWASAGCRWIGWGVESGSQRLLDLINKGTDVRVIERVIKESAEAGISNLPMMIFGLPTSSDQDLYETLGFLERIYGSMSAMSASAFVLFEGTYFARNARQSGMHVDGPQELLRVDGVPVRSRRLKFREISDDGSLRAPRGSIEVSAWMQHRRWLGDVPLLEQLPCEHYLIHVSGGRGIGLKPLVPPARAA
ncbi:MAG: radical SAM protein [Pseudomonadota bacterium]